MEKKKDEPLKLRLITCLIVVVLCTAAFSSSLAAEFNKVKVKDMKIDGSLCSLPKTPAFGLGMAALACISVAQIVGTVVGGARLCAKERIFDISKNRIPFIYLISSWLCYGLAAVMLGTGASMNNGQAYGTGWMDGDCYVVRNGIFGGAAVIAIIAGLLILSFISSLLQHPWYQSTDLNITVPVKEGE